MSRIEVNGLAMLRYCGTGGLAGMKWHTADRRGRAYRCTCCPMFRLPPNRWGPAGNPARKGRKARQPWHMAAVMRDRLDAKD